jgi:putative transposase
VAQEKKAYPVSLLCRVLGVSRSGYYAWIRRQKRSPDPEHEEKLEWVKDLAKSSKYSYGARRMAKALRALGYSVGWHQAGSLMREAGVWVRYPRPYRGTTNSEHKQPVFPNRLQRDFQPEAANRVWAGDITYVWSIYSDGSAKMRFLLASKGENKISPPSKPPTS